MTLRSRTTASPARRWQPPSPVLALIACTGLLVAGWSWVTPAFQAPDENAHAAWVQKFAETGGFGGGPLPGYLSSELGFALDVSRAQDVAGQPQFQPTWDRLTYDYFLESPFSAEQRADAAGPNPAASNPDLYYVLAAAPYLLAEKADSFSRVHAMRLLGVLGGCLLALGAWLLAAELLPRGLGPVLATAVSGLMPMIGFVEGSVSPDVLMYPLWALVLAAGVRALRRPGWRWFAAMLALTAAAVAVKYQSLALLPAVGFVAVVLAARRITWGSPRARALLALAALAVFLVILLLAGQRGGLGAQVQDALRGPGDQSLAFRAREYVSYLWQFYLPRPSFLNVFEMPGDYGFWNTIFKEYVGAFGWHEVKLAGWLYGAAFAVALLALAGAVRAIVLADALRRHAAVMGFFAIITICLTLTLHWTDFSMLKADRTFIQGRYFLPLNPLFGVAVGAAIGVGLLRWPRLQRAAAGATLALLVLLNVVSFATVAERFYA